MTTELQAAAAEIEQKEKKRMTEEEFAEQWCLIPSQIEANTEEARQMAIDTARYKLAKKYRGES